MESEKVQKEVGIEPTTKVHCECNISKDIKTNKTIEKIKAYHGTSKETAREILKSCIFKKGTWFGLEKEDALKCGGEYLFEAQFDKSKFNNEDSWQFFTECEFKLEELETKVLFTIN